MKGHHTPSAEDDHLALHSLIFQQYIPVIFLVSLLLLFCFCKTNRENQQITSKSNKCGLYQSYITTTTNNVEQIREKLWSSWKLTHGWWLAFLSSGGGSPFSCFSAAQPHHCLQCKEVQGLPPSAGKTEKDTSYGSNHPPEALPPGLKHLGSCPGARH